MSFHDVVFPASLSFGSSGGPERRTEVITLASGFEERNATWAHSRRRYDAGLGVRGLDDIHTLLAFFEARNGMLHTFLWKDWADCKSCKPSETPSALDQDIGVSDGVSRTFQLVKRYVSGSQNYTRLISKPMAGTVLLAVNGTSLSEGVGFTVDIGTGLVTLAAATANGAVISAGFEFHVPVRFDTDRIEINLAAFEAGEIPSIPIVEVRV